MLRTLRSPLFAAAGAATAASFATTPGVSWNHCQVPCGIFDDPMRVAMLKEDTATITKAMVKVGGSFYHCRRRRRRAASPCSVSSSAPPPP